MKKALIGYGGHAKEVMAQMGEKLPCFVDDEFITKDTFAISSLDPNKYEVMVAIGSPLNRHNIVKKLPKETKYFTFIHPTSLIMGDVEIGEGSFIGAYSILTTNIKIGKHTILNRGNHIGHDTIIGDYFSAMPGTIISGNCKIDDFVYIGTNASIKEKINIHSFTTIGLNSGVIEDIDQPGIYAGMPAKKIK